MISYPIPSFSENNSIDLKILFFQKPNSENNCGRYHTHLTLENQLYRPSFNPKMRKRQRRSRDRDQKRWEKYRESFILSNFVKNKLEFWLTDFPIFKRFSSECYFLLFHELLKKYGNKCVCPRSMEYVSQVASIVCCLCVLYVLGILSVTSPHFTLLYPLPLP